MTARLGVRVHPKARRDGIAGRLADGTLKLDVSTAPEDGRANAAVEQLVAEALDAPRGHVRVVSGATSRRKVLEIQGMTELEVARRIDAAVRGEGRRGD